MDVVTGRGCLFKKDDNLKTKSILIDLTNTNNPCANTLGTKSLCQADRLRHARGDQSK